jgi:hypothetical protein
MLRAVIILRVCLNLLLSCRVNFFILALGRDNPCIAVSTFFVLFFNYPRPRFLPPSLSSSFKRQSVPIANLSLLNISMDIPKNLRQSGLKKKCASHAFSSANEQHNLIYPHFFFFFAFTVFRYESEKIEEKIQNSSLYKLKVSPQTDTY